MDIVGPDIFSKRFKHFVAEKQILKPNDVSVFSTLSINGRLFACPREQLNSLVNYFFLWTLTKLLCDNKVKKDLAWLSMRV